jgi:hypothetical protein
MEMIAQFRILHEYYNIDTEAYSKNLLHLEMGNLEEWKKSTNDLAPHLCVIQCAFNVCIYLPRNYAV